MWKIPMDSLRILFDFMLPAGGCGGMENKSVMKES